MSSAFGGLGERLREVFSRGAGAELPEAEFDELARAVFSWQYRTNAPYRRFCDARGATPGTVRSWTAIPPVPANAFKHLDLVSGDPTALDRIFRTSGTTRGAAERGRHPVPDLELYRAASLPGIREWLVPDVESIPVVSLVPPVEATPDSSLATMVDFTIEAFGEEGSGSFAHPDAGVDADGVQDHLEALVDADRAVLLVGTAFAFVHWLDRTAARGWSIRLPAGSRVMETGGFKGRTREVTRDELYAMIEARLGVPRDRIVNEYGMTELLSQFWEPVLTGGPRRHVAAPWLRTRVVDPVDLGPVPDGEPGLLLHVDLANVGSVAAVLTEDRGILHPDGLELLGRSPGAEPRGCSMTMEDFVEANRR